MNPIIKISLLFINCIALGFAINWTIKSNYENEPIITTIVLAASLVSIIFDNIIKNIKVKKSKRVNISTTEESDTGISVTKSEDVRIEIQKKRFNFLLNYLSVIVKNSEHANIQVLLPRERYIHKDLTTIPQIRSPKIFGRALELKKIRQLFKKNQRILLLNGIGGIGKTTLAQWYLQNNRSSYDYVLWINNKYDIPQSFYNIQLIVNLNLYEVINKINRGKNFYNEVFDIIINSLKELKSVKKNLLVIDNASEDLQFNELFDKLFIGDNWQILVTSRESLEGFHKLVVSFMDKNSSIELFYEYYKKEKNDTVVSNIVEILGFHTLAIELLAKSAQNQKNLNLSQILLVLKEKGLSATSGVEISTSYDKVKVYTYLSRCLEVAFDITGLSKLQKEVLQTLSVLTSNFHDQSIIHELLPLKSNVGNALAQLSRKGWVIEQHGTFRVHQVIQEAVRKQLKPSFNKCITLANYFGKELRVRMDSDKSKKFEYTKYVDDLESISKFLINDNEDLLASVLLNLATLKWLLGEQKKAKELNAQCIEIYERNNPNSVTLATNYNNYSIVNWELGDLKEALLFQIKAIEIYKSKRKLDLVALSDSYNNISLIYWDMWDLDTAEMYQIESIGIRENIYEEKHPYLAQSYSNLSIIYIRKKEFAKALEWQLKAFNIRKEIYDQPHPDLAQSYNNLSVIYRETGELQMAFKHQSESLKIREQILTKNSPDLAISYDNISLILKMQNKFKEALSYQLKGIKIRESPGFSASPNLGKSYMNLAEIYLLLNNKSDASVFIEKSIDVLNKWMAKDSEVMRECIKIRDKINGL